jgi:hypothetical protein
MEWFATGWQIAVNSDYSLHIERKSCWTASQSAVVWIKHTTTPQNQLKDVNYWMEKTTTTNKAIARRGAVGKVAGLEDKCV